MDAVGALQAVLQLAGAIVSARQGAKVNKKKCARFAGRVTTVREQLRDFNPASRGKQHLPSITCALCDLLNALQRGHDLVVEFSSKSYFKRFIGHQTDANEFVQLYVDIQHAMSTLQFGMACAKWTAAEDANDASEDLDALRRSMQQVINDMRRELDEYQTASAANARLFSDERMRNEHLERQLAAREAQLQQFFLEQEQLARRETVKLRDPFIIPYDQLELKEELGRGAYGVVYHAEWTQRQEPVAVKLLNLTPGRTADKLRVVFHKEIELMKGVVNAPHVVPLRGFCLDPINCCIVTKLAKYGSLYNVLHPEPESAAEELNARLTWDLKWLWVDQMVRAVNELHSRKIVHADIKSLNFLVDDGYNVMLCDFGLSLIKASSSGKTSSVPGAGGPSALAGDGDKTAAGTYLWMAPELFRGKKSSAASDVYALAVVMWELATGDVPWDGQEDKDIVISCVRNGDRPDIPDDADVPQHFRTLIVWCWAQEPSQRPTCVQILAKMRELHAAPLKRAAHQLVDGSSSPSASSPSASSPSPHRPHPTAWTKPSVSSSSSTDSVEPGAYRAANPKVQQERQERERQERERQERERQERERQERERQERERQERAQRVAAEQAFTTNLATVRRLVQQQRVTNELITAIEAVEVATRSAQVCQQHVWVNMDWFVCTNDGVRLLETMDSVLKLPNVSTNVIVAVSKIVVNVMLVRTLYVGGPGFSGPFPPIVSSLQAAANRCNQGDRVWVHRALLALPEHGVNMQSADGCRAAIQQAGGSVPVLFMSKAQADCGGVVRNIELFAKVGLRGLTLRWSSLNEDAEFMAFDGWLRKVPQLTSLDVPINEIGAEGCRALASSLHHVPQLTELNLWDNKIGAEGCRALASSLQHVPQLTSLDVARTSMGAEGCRALASSLQHVPHLMSLNLWNNSIGDEGCRALASSLQHVLHLTSLDVRSNWIGAEGKAALAPYQNRMKISF